MMNKQVSLLRRAISFVVDLYLGSLLGTLPISFATYFTIGEMTQNVFLLEKGFAIFVLIISLILLISYYVIIPCYVLKGQTLGKKLMDICIVYEQHNSLIKRQILFMLALTSFGSVLGALLSIMSGYDCIEILSDVTMSISLVAVVMILFTKSHLGIYDKLFQTSIQELKKV